MKTDLRSRVQLREMQLEHLALSIDDLAMVRFRARQIEDVVTVLRHSQPESKMISSLENQQELCRNVVHIYLEKVNYITRSMLPKQHLRPVVTCVSSASDRQIATFSTLSPCAWYMEEMIAHVANMQGPRR